MNYYQPLQLSDKEGKPTGFWHMTCTNDNKTWAVGYCRENKNSETECKHNSPEEASDCYRKYCRERQDGIMAGFKMEDDEEGTVLNITSSY